MFLSWNVVRFIFIKFCFALNFCYDKRIWHGLHITDIILKNLNFFCFKKVHQYCCPGLAVVGDETLVLNFETGYVALIFWSHQSIIILNNNKPAAVLAIFCSSSWKILNNLVKCSHVIIATAQCSCEKIHKFWNLFYLSLVWGKLSNFPFLLVLS